MEERIALIIADYMNKERDTLEPLARFLATGGAVELGKRIASIVTLPEAED